MKKQMAFIVAVLMVLSSCGGQQPVPSQAESRVADSSSEPAFDSQFTLLDFNGVQLRFVNPDEVYDILGITTFGEGYAAIYQQPMPDSFNKIYSRDEVFYNISTQLFTADGTYLRTVDSLRHNTGKITEPIVCLTPHTDTITFEVWQKNDAGSTEATCFTLALTEQGVQVLGYNPNNDRYSQATFVGLSADGETQLQYTDDYDYEQDRSLIRFRMASRAGEVASLSMPDFDASFSNALYNTAHGIDAEDWINDQQNPLYVLDVSLNAQSKTAALTNGKIFCKLNFGEKSYSIERGYTEAMLGKLVATSPDGTRQIFAADERNYFESESGCDYVVKGPEGIHFLFLGSEIDELYFLDNNRIFANTFGALAFYDAASGVELSGGPAFDFGTQQNPYNKSTSGIARIVVGTAVDEANHVLLIVHRPYTFGSGVLWQGTARQTEALPVTLTVLDWDGKLLNAYNTGMTMQAFAKFSINILSVKPNGDGTADLVWGDNNRLKIRYMA
ncbi:MAG TPA: hypothetical protein VN626_00680 [Clostridia bacterium]|nr:hypothetical protein [Clostridia bacterium]